MHYICMYTEHIFICILFIIVLYILYTYVYVHTYRDNFMYTWYEIYRCKCIPRNTWSTDRDCNLVQKKGPVSRTPGCTYIYIHTLYIVFYIEFSSMFVYGECGNTCWLMRLTLCLTMQTCCLAADWCLRIVLCLSLSLSYLKRWSRLGCGQGLFTMLSMRRMSSLTRNSRMMRDYSWWQTPWTSLSVLTPTTTTMKLRRLPHVQIMWLPELVGHCRNDICRILGTQKDF